MLSHAQVSCAIRSWDKFERLKGKLANIASLSQIESLLGWDEQVNLPERLSGSPRQTDGSTG